MRDEGKILFVCLPFAAGIAISQAALPLPHLWSATAGGLSLPVCCILTFICSRNRSSRASFAALFFFAGIFCSATHAMCLVPLPRGPLGRLASGTAAAFLRLTDSVPFGDEDTAPLLKALLCADRSGLSHEIKATFRSSGASHLLALSGLHLGVIYGIVSRAAVIIGNSPWARAVRCCTIIAISAFYTLMTGASPSIVRAFLFISISELRNLTPGRSRKPLRILAAALTVQLAMDPEVITSLGFQLSYLAMCGICVLMPPLKGLWPAEEEPGKGKFSPMRKIWENVAMSLSCQAFTAPLVWLEFHTFPKYFLLTNLLAMPLTTGVIWCAVLTLTLEAAGICPQALIALTDKAAELLLHTLETISGM